MSARAYDRRKDLSVHPAAELRMRLWGVACEQPFVAESRIPF